MIFNKLKVSNILKKYADQDYILKKRALFLYYFIIAAISISVVLLFTTTYLQIKNPKFERVHLPTVAPIFGLIITFLICTYFLVKGKFSLSANIFILFSLASIWFIIFIDKSQGSSKINTLVFVFAALSTLPLIINSKKRILIYGAINLLIFLVFIGFLYFSKEQYGINIYGFRDILIDISIALIFSTIIHYNVYSINSVALRNAKEEIEHRRIITTELQYHKNNLEKLVKEKTIDLESAVKELKVTNEELSAKNEIIHNQNNELISTLQRLKETQSQLLQAEKMASLGTLTAGVAHEINNPLNYLMGAIVGLENYFNEYGSKDEKKTSILLNSIDEGIERISGIVNGLGQFSRDNSSYNENCNIHAILDNCLVMLNNQLKRRIVVVKNFNHNQIIVKGNVGKLHQVFINILTNAVQAIESKGEIRIDTEIQLDQVIVVISDNGAGISKENIKQIEDPFFTTKPPGEGTGLGLSISYTIIKEHNGVINFESELNKGTKVIITLPIIKIN